MFGVYVGKREFCRCQSRGDADRIADMLVAGGVGFVYVAAIL